MYMKHHSGNTDVRQNKTCTNLHLSSVVKSDIKVSSFVYNNINLC